jgi:hypothetical protein
MACVGLYDGISSILNNCEITAGGISKIQITQYQEGATFSGNNSSGLVQSIDFNTDDKTTNYVEALTNNDNGTTVVEKTLTVFLSGYDGDRHAVLNELCNPYKKFALLITFADGSTMYCGMENGAVLTSVRFESGANAEDTNGVTLTFTAKEKKHSNTYTAAMG